MLITKIEEAAQQAPDPEHEVLIQQFSIAKEQYERSSHTLLRHCSHIVSHELHEEPACALKAEQGAGYMQGTPSDVRPFLVHVQRVHAPSLVRADHAITHS